MLIKEAYAQGAATGGGDMLTQLLPLVLIFVVFYFLLIRPQQKKMKAQRELIASVKRGDRVVLGSGIIGLVVKVIGENEAVVEIADGVRVRVIKSSVGDILARGEPVRGGREEKAKDEAADDEKPYLPTPVAQPAGGAKPGGLFGGLFGRKN